MSRPLFSLIFLCAGIMQLCAADPSEQFLNAYQSFQQGEKLERMGNSTEAVQKYRFAESLLASISKSDPTWQKPVVEYRLKKTRESLDRLQGNSSGTTPLPPSPYSPTESEVTPPPPSQGPSITIVPPSSSTAPDRQPGSDSNAGVRKMRRQIEELKGQLQDARDAITAQKNRTGDLENAEWVKKRSEMTQELDLARRRISNLEHDLKARSSWVKDIKDLQNKLDAAVADKLAADELYQEEKKKSAGENALLMLQLREAGEKLALGTDSKQLVDQLRKEIESGKAAMDLLKEKLGSTEQSAKDSSARNEELKKQLQETVTQVAEAKKQSAAAAGLQESLVALQAKFEKSEEAARLNSKKLSDLEKSSRKSLSSASRREGVMEADLAALEEEHSRLVAKAGQLAEAARDASRVKGLESDAEGLKKTVQQLQTRVDSGEKELTKARAESATSLKEVKLARQNAVKLALSAEADRSVGEEEQLRLRAKLDQALLSLNSLTLEAATLGPLRKEVETLKGKLSENSTALEQSQSKIALAASELAESQRREKESLSLRDMLQQQNNSLQEQLKASMDRIASQVDHGEDSAALQEKLKNLQSQIELNAKNYAESQRQFEELAKERPQQEKLLADKEKSLTGAKQEADKLRGDLDQANQKIKGLKQQESKGEDRLKDLQDQLASKDAQIARLNKRKGKTSPDEKTLEENTLLRGIVLRALKEEAKRDQAKRLMEDELKRLNVQSQSLADQITVLTSVTSLTPQERALFKDAQLVVIADAGADKIKASISAPMTVDQEKAGAVTTPSQGADGQTVTNPPSDNIPWQGRFKELLSKAKEEFDRQDYLQAESSFQDALKLSPEDYFALSNLGVVQFQLGKMPQAEESLKRAAKNSSDSSFALTTLGIVHYRQERLEDAEKVLKKSIKINDLDFTAHNYLGIVFAASGRGSAGEKEIMKALEINPQYADAHFNLAVIYATGKPPSKMLARKHYKQAVELGAPPDPSLEHLVQ